MVLNHFLKKLSRKSPLRWLLGWGVGWALLCMWIFTASATVWDAHVVQYQQYLNTIRPILAELTPIQRRLKAEPALMTQQHWTALVHQFHLVANNRIEQIEPYAQQGYQSAQLILKTYQDIEALSACLSMQTPLYAYQDGNQSGLGEWKEKQAQLTQHLNQLEAFYRLEQSISQTRPLTRGAYPSTGSMGP